MNIDWVGFDYEDEALVGQGDGPAAVRLMPATIKNLTNLKHAVKAMAKKLEYVRVDRASKAKDLPALLLGLDTTTSPGNTVAAAGEETITSRPSDIIRVTDLVVEEAFANDFSIRELAAGRTDIITGDQRVPASAFLSSTSRPPVYAERVSSGAPFAATVTNNGGAARHFRAVASALHVAGADDC